MLLYRLDENLAWLQLLEGSCITESQYKKVFYSDRCLFSVIQDFERKDMVEYKDEEYCREKNIECVLFYNEKELEKFMQNL